MKLSIIYWSFFLLFFSAKYNGALAEYIIENNSEDVDKDVKRPSSVNTHPFLSLLFSPPIHPLDPLSAAEVTRTSKIIGRVAKCIYIVITLKEPPKSVLIGYFLNNKNPSHGAISRRSFTTCINKQTGRVIEYIVDLDNNTIISENTLPMGIQPLFTDDDWTRAEEITMNDPEFIRRCEYYGYPNQTLVFKTDWTMGYVADKPEYRGKRILQMMIFGQQFPEDNAYAHPLPFAVVLDLKIKKVIGFLEYPTGYGLSTDNRNVTVPTTPYNFDQDILGKDFLRKDIKPIVITSPYGPSYTITGNKIEWQKWSFRVGFNSREGLVLHWINYNDNGKVRPLIYRTSISEMWIPYGDSRPPTGPMKNVFDEGEFGLGFDTMESIAQEDCLGSVYFFDGTVNNNDGEPVDKPQCICVYEEDAGILWKHQDEVSEKTSTVRSHRLAVVFTVQAGNYNYIFHWYFYQDASMELVVKLSGVMVTTLLANNAKPPPFGTLVADQIFAPMHQHFFCVRMDTDIDGRRNAVETVDVVAADNLSYEFNPYGNAIVAKHTLLRNQGQARTKNSPDTSRGWKIFNPNIKNPVTKKPGGYVLKSDNKGPALWNIDSPARQRGNFTAYDVWVTKHDDRQVFAGGDYLNGYGLPEWVNEHEETSIVNEDIVLWHVFGLTHYPRLEDWPVMPTESAGFKFIPVNFFTSNPGLDVPNVHKND